MKWLLWAGRPKVDTNKGEIFYSPPWQSLYDPVDIGWLFLSVWSKRSVKLHSALSGAEVKNVCNFTTTPSIRLRSVCLGTHPYQVPTTTGSCIYNQSPYQFTEQVGSRGNTTGGVRFVSRPGFRLFWLRCSQFSLVSSDECRDRTLW